MKTNYLDILANDFDEKRGNKSSEDIIDKYKKEEYRIVTEQARYPLASFEEIFKNHNLRPDYQRKKVWDVTRKSKLIESFIVNIPIPPVFLYEVEFSEYEVMDGQQRISTIIDYYNDDFELKGLELWSELNGKRYSQLPERIRKGIDRRYLSAIILLKETATNEEEAIQMKQFVFERLNTGALKLEPQEIRNALFPSKFNNLIIELSKNQTFKKLWSFESDDKNEVVRMEDCELILRFFAYKSACKHKISKSTRDILDTYMKRAVVFEDTDIDVLRCLFIETINKVGKIFGDDAFKSAPKNKRSEKMIYDTLMLYVSELVESNKIIPDKSLSNEKYEIIIKYGEDFNGKYTAINIVNNRKDIFKKELEGKF